MEALIIAVGALAAIVLIEASYWIAISLTRWAPVIAAGALSGWLAHRHGMDALQAVGVCLVASLIARHIVRRRYIYDDSDFP